MAAQKRLDQLDSPILPGIFRHVGRKSGTPVMVPLRYVRDGADTEREIPVVVRKPR